MGNGGVAGAGEGWREEEGIEVVQAGRLDGESRPELGAGRAGTGEARGEEGAAKREPDAGRRGGGGALGDVN